MKLHEILTDEERILLKATNVRNVRIEDITIGELGELCKVFDQLYKNDVLAIILDRTILKLLK